MAQVQVWARSATIAAVLKHQNGIAFDPLTLSAFWPDDNWTARRVADGDVSLVPATGLVPSAQLTLQAPRPPLPVYIPVVAKTGP